MTITSLADAATSQGPNFDKFDITKDQVTARAVIPRLEMASAFTHALYRAEGRFVESNGKTRLDWDQGSYAGKFYCLGDENLVAASPRTGDPTRCPLCAAMHDETKLVGMPKKYYALNVVQYTTKPNTHDVVGLGVTNKLWVFGNSNNLKPLQTALKETGKKIGEMDFLFTANLEKIAYKDWQISFVETPAYMRNADLGASMQAAMTDDALYSNDDLSAALGTRASKEQLENELTAARAAAMAGRQIPEDNVFVTQDSTSTANEIPMDAGGSVVTEIPMSDLDNLLGDA